MAEYDQQTWVPETGVGDGTEFTADRMNHMEDGIAAALIAEVADLVYGRLAEDNEWEGAQDYVKPTGNAWMNFLNASADLRLRLTLNGSGDPLIYAPTSLQINTAAGLIEILAHTDLHLYTEDGDVLINADNGKVQVSADEDVEINAVGDVRLNGDIVGVNSVIEGVEDPFADDHAINRGWGNAHYIGSAYGNAHYLGSASGGAATIINTRASRPTAGSVPAGTRFLSSDTIGDWTSDGSVWIRTNAPAGSILMTVRRSADLGYIMGDGASYLVATALYVDLITALTQGSTYEYGGVFGTSFLAPDFRDKMPRGRATLTTAIVNNTTAPAITIAAANLPVHNHTMNHTHSLASGNYSGFITADHYHNLSPGANYWITGYAPEVSSGSNAYHVNAYNNPTLSTGGVSSNHQHDISHSHSFTGDTGNGGFANTAITIPQPQHLTVNFMVKL